VKDLFSSDEAMPQGTVLNLLDSAQHLDESKARKAFKRLLKQVSTLQEQLSRWVAFEERKLRMISHEVLPLQNDIDAAKREMVLACAKILEEANSADKSERLTQSERRFLVQLVVDQAGLLLETQPDDDALLTLHDLYAEFSFAEQQAEERNMARATMEGLFGLDLGETKEGGFEDVMAEAMRKLQQRAQEDQAQREQEREARAAKRRAKPAQQAKTDAQEHVQEAAAAAMSQSLKDIYRKLASALHPDRAVSEIDSAERHSKMQMLNKAYETNDLLTLLNLQLEMEQIDASSIRETSEEKITHYNKVLKNQVKDLQAELENFKRPWGSNFMMLRSRSNIGPEAAEQSMRADIHQLSLTLKDIRRDIELVVNQSSRKAWMKAQRELAKLEVQGGEDFDLLGLEAEMFGPDEMDFDPFGRKPPPSKRSAKAKTRR
jgi:hypothetical protein